MREVGRERQGIEEGDREKGRGQEEGQGGRDEGGQEARERGQGDKGEGGREAGGGRQGAVTERRGVLFEVTLGGEALSEEVWRATWPIWLRC